MLTSLMIANNPDFLMEVAHSVSPLIEVRKKIISSVKIIVNYEIMNFNQYMSEWMEQTYKVDKPNNMLIDAKIKKYAQYLKLPFPQIFIENDTGGVLVEELEGGYRMTCVFKDGSISPVVTDCYPEQRYENGSVRLVNRYSDLFVKLYGEDYVTNYKNTYIAFITAQVLEALLFLNISNVRTHTYKLSNKEFQKIPKVLRPRFEYHILDIFREKEKYVSLNEIMEHLHCRKDSESIARRAHLVRGHFKQKKNGLFWWSSFMRCRKNIDDIGFVAKDYNLR